MGVDFIRKTAKSFHKGLDQSRIDLGTPDLFTQRPDCEPRAYVAKIQEDRKLSPGEKLCVRLCSGRVFAQHGVDVVAEFSSPPAQLVEALEESFGEACGTVRRIYEIAQTAEVIIC